MKAIIINGSPKGEKSNSLVLTKAFIEGMQIDDYKIIDTNSFNIKPCLGCFACWNKTPGTCVLKDDMSEVLEMIITADIVVWSFPLYYFNVPSNMKVVIDRMLPMNLPFMVSDSDSGSHPSRYDLSHQKHAIISTCGFWTAEKNYDSVIAMFNHIYGESNYLKIYCGQGELMPYTELRNVINPYLDVVKKAGSEFIQGKVSEETKKKLRVPLLERSIFEKLADTSWGVDKETQEKMDESLIFTTQMMSLYKSDGVKRIVEFRYPDINKTYQAVLDIDDTKIIENNFIEATTIITTPFTVWKQIANGEISGQQAMFERLYKVEGDFDLMLKWDELFSANLSSGIVENKSADGPKVSNMMLLLLPWIMLWVITPMSNLIGSVVAIVCATLIPFVWTKYKPVIYEKLSIMFIVLLSCLLISGYETGIIITLSYLIFGSMWVLSCFTKIPLTAYYSSKDYGEDKAYSNPLFMRTNRILTMGWGILYIVTALIAYVFKGYWFVSFISMGAPIIMGIFTRWFQKWYPVHFAKGK